MLLKEVTIQTAQLLKKKTMSETTSLPILLTLDELLHNLFCLTTASVHIVSLYPQRLF